MNTNMRSAVVALFSVVLSVSCVQAQGFKFLEVTVLDPDGKPLADVPVDIRIDGMEFPMPTNEDGIVSVNVPAGDETELELSVSHEGCASISARWAKGNKLPEQVTIPLHKGKTIGGIVHDEHGNPVEGVKVEALATANDDHGINSGKGELRMEIPRDLAVTDSEGRWQSHSGPTEDVSIQMRFLHPDYVRQEGFSYRGGSWEELQSLKKIVVLSKGVVVAGKVLDGEQSPIAGAKIVTGPDRYWSNKLVVTTEEDGKYQLPEPQVGRLVLTVTAPGFAPELKSLNLEKPTGNIDFQLEPGKNIRLHVVDKDGKPVEGVRVYAEEWRGNRSLDLSKDEKTDPQGDWEWKEAPADAVKYGLSKDGHIGLEVDLKPSDEVHTLTLNPVVVVCGKVTDKETTEPINSFKYVEGVWWEPEYDTYILQSSHVEVGKNGEFEFRMTSACAKFCVRVDADGYRPLVSREILTDEGEIEIDFPLQKGLAPTGTVLTPDGELARNASVALGGIRMPVMINNGTVQQFSADAVTTTDREGKFELPMPGDDFTIVVSHETGWAELNNPSDDKIQTIKLSPWCQVTGVALQGDRPIVGEPVMARLLPSKNSQSTSQWYNSGMTNERGEFYIGRMRTGPALVHRSIRYAVSGADSWMTAYSHLKNVEIKPGTNTQVKLGGDGRRVSGQLTVADNDREQIDWTMGLVQLTKTEKAGTDDQSEADYAAAVDENGQFAFIDVLPGSYDLSIDIYPKIRPSTGRWLAIATLNEPREIAQGDREEAVDLGSFTVELVKSQD